MMGIRTERVYNAHSRQHNSEISAPRFSNGFLQRRLHIYAMTAQGPAISGSDRIFVELAKRWSAVGQEIRIYAWREGAEMCHRNGVGADLVEEWPAMGVTRGRLRAYLGLTVSACRRAIRVPVEENDLLYSASDFWPDVLPAVLTRARSGATWIASFYLFAPPPWSGFEGAALRGHPRIEDVFFWLSQRLSLPLIRRFASVVLVTCEADRQKLVAKGMQPERLVVVKGGVDVALADRTAPAADVAYDAVFVGRLHVQKGVKHLLHIWQRVVDRRPNSRLGIIGVGPLEPELHELRSELGLQPSVDFLGYRDGADKLAIEKASKMVVHPALYDSGGMAACEAFSCGLPGISFDLPELKDYYPHGMIKIPPYDLDAFASAVLAFLDDEDFRKSVGTEARQLAEAWDWSRRSIELAAEIDAGLLASP